MLCLTKERRRRLQESDPRWLEELVVRLVTAPLSLIAICVFAAAIPLWDRTFVHPMGPTPGAWQDGLPLAPLVLSFLHNIICSIYTLRQARPAHPAAKITVDFLVAAILVPAITFATWGSTFRLWRPSSARATSKVTCNDVNTFTRDCFPALYKIGSLELTGVTFACLVWILHCALLIKTCHSTFTRRHRHRHRRHKRRHRRGHGNRQEFVGADDGDLPNRGHYFPPQEYHQFSPYDQETSEITIPAPVVEKNGSLMI